MGAGQSIVVEEHGALQLEVFFQEWYALDLLHLLLETRATRWQACDLLNIPDVTGLRNVFVAVDLSLLVCPVWEWRSVSPHGDFRGNMDKLEVRGHGLEVLTRLAVFDLDFEQSLVESLVCNVGGNCSKFLVGWEVWRGDIVGQQDMVSDKMAKSNEVAILDWTLLALGWGKNLPVVVGIVVWVSSDLLTLTGDTTVVVAEWVLVDVGMKIDTRLLVLHGNVIAVFNADRLRGHDVVGKGGLELWSHEIVAWARSVQDGKVDLEPEEVEHERNDDQANNASCEVFAKLWKAELSLAAVDIEKIPQIEAYWHANGEEGEYTNVLCGDDTAQADTGEE